MRSHGQGEMNNLNNWDYAYVNQCDLLFQLQHLRNATEKGYTGELKAERFTVICTQHGFWTIHLLFRSYMHRKVWGSELDRNSGFYEDVTAVERQDSS